MAEPPPASKGHPLGRKAGPLPVYGWLLIVAGLAIAWVLFRKPKVQANVGTSAGSSPDLSAQGAPPSAAADNAGTSADLLSALGQQNSDLANALVQQGQTFSGAYGDLASTAFGQISDLAASTATGSFNTQTQPTYWNMPDANAPSTTYAAPVGTSPLKSYSPAVRSSPPNIPAEKLILKQTQGLGSHPRAY